MNQTFLIGNVGKDPELHQVGENKVCKFSIATRGYGKEAKDDWHNLVCWNKVAEIAEKYVKKGSKIAVVGRISNRSYEKDGVTKYTSEVIVSEIELLDKKADGVESEKSQPQAKQPDVPSSGSDDGTLPF